MTTVLVGSSTYRGYLGTGTPDAKSWFRGDGTWQYTLDISNAAGGQIVFPATQNSSANANTLDDYEEGTWTPAITFSTPGDLSITYGIQVGEYTKIGNCVTCSWTVTTSSFTHTTASGSVNITGFPFTAKNSTGHTYRGAVAIQGVTKAGYTQWVSGIQINTTIATANAQGSGVAGAQTTSADMPTGGSVNLSGANVYYT